jgi:hypothetical protein
VPPESYSEGASAVPGGTCRFVVNGESGRQPDNLLVKQMRLQGVDDA